MTAVWDNYIVPLRCLIGIKTIMQKALNLHFEEKGKIFTESDLKRVGNAKVKKINGKIFRSFVN